MPRQPTERQREIIEEKTGCFTVRACPGSGKTYTVAARFTRLLKDWKAVHQGIAVASFTNVAWQEVNSYLTTEWGVHAPRYPHFLGTLDSFINNYIFLPFGHLVMNVTARPTLCGPPHDNTEPIGKWLFWGQQACNTKRCLLNQFTYNLDGNVVKVGAPAAGHRCSEPQHPCVTKKHIFSQQGYATQSDANYFALQVLRKYPAIATALVHRFPLVMIDEAQDTSATQMAILDSLVKQGLGELMLVGDPDQAIYEWREAEPSLFLAKCEEWKTNSTTLVESWRSSQMICDVASRMSSSGEPMKAINNAVARTNAAPTIVGYTTEAQLRSIIDEFCRDCAAYGIQSPGMHILTRGREFLNAVLPGTAPLQVEPWKETAGTAIDVAHAKYLFDGGQYAEALRMMERAAHRLENPAAKGPLGFRQLYRSPTDVCRRGALFELLRRLPSTSTNPLGQWVTAANAVLTNYGAPFDEMPIEIKRRSAKANYPALSFRDVFGAVDEEHAGKDFSLGTIHAVKGTSLDAVLVILKKKGRNEGNYVNLFSNGLSHSEELRIVYVAITRARKVLRLAVPHSDVEKWKEYLHVPQPASSTEAVLASNPVND